MIVYRVFKICTSMLFILSTRCYFSVHGKVNLTEDAMSILLNIYKVSEPREQTIISVLSKRNNDQIQQIKAEYHRITAQDLSNDCNELLEGDFSRLVQDMLMPRSEYYAHKLNEAMVGLGTDESTISEILCPMSKTEILEVSSAYETLYGKTLREDLISETSGSYQHLLILLCDALRPDTEVNPKTADLDSYNLQISLNHKWHTEMELDFNKVFTTRSFEQLKIIFEKFKKETNLDIRTILTEKTFEDEYYGLDVIANVAYSKSGFFANQFEACMKGIGTNEKRLNRLVVGRSEIDLPEIRDKYAEIYNMSLVDRIKDDTSGSYCKLLCKLVDR